MSLPAPPRGYRWASRDRWKTAHLGRVVDFGGDDYLRFVCQYDRETLDENTRGPGARPPCKRCLSWLRRQNEERLKSIRAADDAVRDAENRLRQELLMHLPPGSVVFWKHGDATLSGTVSNYKPVGTSVWVIKQSGNGKWLSASEIVAIEAGKEAD